MNCYLKAASYLEQAAAAADTGTGAAYRGYPQPDNSYIYRQLSELYRQLGRPDAAAAAMAKAASRLRNNPMALASLYEQQGQMDEAEALYKQTADDSRNPQQTSGAWQSLASLYQREGRSDDGAAAMEQAIAALQNTDNPGLAAQAGWMCQNLASMLQQAGQTQQAEQIYQQKLAESQGSPYNSPYNATMAYAQFLNATKRAAQGEKLMSDYLASHSDMDPGMEANALNFLAGITSDPKQAEEYRRSAAEKWPPPLPAPTVQNSVRELMTAAQKAAGQQRFEDAFSLTMQAIAAAPEAVDRDAVADWTFESVANFIGQKQPARSEELYQNLLAAVEGWSSDTVEPLKRASEAYIRFLTSQGERSEQAPAAIERYGAVTSAAEGAEAGARAVLDRSIVFESSEHCSVIRLIDGRIAGCAQPPPDSGERLQSSLKHAIFLAQDRLRLEESLSGSTSQP